MMHPFKLMLGAAFLAGLAAVPVTAQAESAKPSKSEASSASKSNQASVDEFEENRRAHMQKSKENNTKKSEE